MKTKLTRKQKEYLKRKFGILAMDEVRILNFQGDMKYWEISLKDEFNAPFVSKVPTNKEQREGIKEYLKHNRLYSRRVSCHP